jgi:hypothetical protein
MKEVLIKKQKELFHEWKQTPLHKNAVFISDGIIDIDKWLRSEKKIALFLKEAYGEKQDWDLSQLIREEWKGPKTKMWWTVSYWLFLLQKTTKDYIPLFPDSDSEFNECKDYLLSSAVINIRKSDGETSSNFETLKKYTEKDKKFLIQQIELINPDIILCGYTFNHLKELLGEVKPVPNTEWIYKYGDRLIIDFWHPANQYPNRLCYYTLGHLYQRVLSNNF